MNNICVNCDTEVFKNCPWVLYGEPIEGWTAKKVHNKHFDTYQITACPKFKNQNPARCTICGKPLPEGRRRYCSPECRAKGACIITKKNEMRRGRKK